MGIGTVGTSENTEELPDGEDAAEYHTDTDVYTSFDFVNSGSTDYIGSTRFSIYNSDNELPRLKDGPEGPAYLIKVNPPSVTHNPDGSVTVGAATPISGYPTDEIGIQYVKPTDTIRVFVENPDYYTEPYGVAPYKELGKYEDGDFISADGGASISYEIKTKSGASIKQGSVSFSCPAGEEAMGWFDWHTPSRAQDITITLKANSPGIYLLDKDGNSCKTLVIDASISKVEEKTPPDPKVTDTRPSWQKVYSSSSVAKNISGYAPKNDVTELSWYVWAYDWTQNELDSKKASFNYITSSPNWDNPVSPYMGANYEKVEYYADQWGVDNRYYRRETSTKPTGSTYTNAVILSGEAHKVEYTVSLNAEMSIAPSRRCYTATHSSSTGLYTMKSGYGIEITMNSHISGDTEFCTGAQIGNVLFPEFNYNRESSAKYNRLLEKVGNDLVFKKNEYSTYGDRVHFTPIWYPDNKYYTVYAEVFDVWCPAGQLSMRLTDRIIIKGNVYDDWHVGPTKP